ncbi:hypothetical protein DFP72DRAFT_1072192 [Ephemerocybe angulata]|uniref:Uncharacterized protein n=1 Tax=Ephemerocybe angulata TaxID=980116 RepID=A0A8H6HRC2_9AGAR|nr:hypothetical protein DFP72DRAFT_1072192 [Tulosesus angulatus]
MVKTIDLSDILNVQIVSNNPVPWFDAEKKILWERENVVAQIREDDADAQLYMVHHALPWWDVPGHIAMLARVAILEQDGRFKALTSIAWCPRFVDRLFVRVGNRMVLDMFLKAIPDPYYGLASRPPVTQVPGDIFSLFDERLNYPETSVGTWLDFYHLQQDADGQDRIYLLRGFITRSGPEWQKARLACLPVVTPHAQPALARAKDARAAFGANRVLELDDLHYVLPMGTKTYRTFFGGLELIDINVKQAMPPSRPSEINTSLYKQAFVNYPRTAPSDPDPWPFAERKLSDFYRSAYRFPLGHAAQVVYGPFLGHVLALRSSAPHFGPEVDTDEAYVVGLEADLETADAREETFTINVTYLCGQIRRGDLVVYNPSPGGPATMTRLGWVEKQLNPGNYLVRDNETGALRDVAQLDTGLVVTKVFEFHG